MRSIILAASVAVLMVAAAGSALADVFSVSFDAPIVYTFTEETLTDESVGGFKVGLTLPFLVGLGYENYKVKGKAGTAPFQVDFEYKVAMYDIFLDIPFPVANLVIGAGGGKGQIDTVPPTGGLQDASLVQAFVSVGIPFALLFDAHVGYHAIRGEAEPVGGGTALNLDASMATVGIKVGF
jgi:hypothetical protein